MDGQWVTPEAARGKDAADLTDAERAEFKKILEADISEVDNYHDLISKAKGLRSVLSGARDLRLAIHVPEVIRAGQPFTASVSEAVVGNKLRAVEWRLNEARPVPGPVVSLTAPEPGVYSLRVRVQDPFGAEGTMVRTLKVQPAPQLH